MRRYGLRDDQFVRIEHLLPGRPGYVGRNSGVGQSAFCRGGDLEVPLRRAVARSARAVWRLEDHSHAVLAMGEKRCLGDLFKTLADDPDNEYAMIDATIVRAHQHSAGGGVVHGSTCSDGDGPGVGERTPSDLDACRAVQTEPGSPPPHSATAAQGHQLAGL